MLQSEREYQNTRIQLARMEAAYQEAEAKLATQPDIPAIVRRGQLNGMGLIVSDLKAELAKYEQLRARKIKNDLL